MKDDIFLKNGKHFWKLHVKANPGALTIFKISTAVVALSHLNASWCLDEWKSWTPHKMAPSWTIWKFQNMSPTLLNIYNLITPCSVPAHNGNQLKHQKAWICAKFVVVFLTNDPSNVIFVVMTFLLCVRIHSLKERRKSHIWFSSFGAMNGLEPLLTFPSKNECSIPCLRIARSDRMEGRVKFCTAEESRRWWS